MANVYFATNRNLTGTSAKPAFGSRFHVEGPFYLRYGKAVVDPPTSTRKDYTIRSVKLARERMSKDESKRVLGSDEIFGDLRRRMASEDTDTIILIHGYAATFEDVVKRGAKLKEHYRFGDKELNVFVFSWPANGEMIPILSYYDDRKDAAASGVAVARAVLRLADFLKGLERREFCEHSLHLVAHSMGNYALRNAVQGLRGELGHGPLPRIFENVFLMAADEDNDTFEHDHKLRLLPDLTRAVHVYFSAADQALTISDTTKAMPDRLGSEGPRLKDNLPRKVTLVDCEDVDYTTAMDAKHQYYHAREEVRADVRQVLAGNRLDQVDGRVYEPDKRAYRIRSFKERQQDDG